jgi:hypothetical protein
MQQIRMKMRARDEWEGQQLSAEYRKMDLVPQAGEVALLL